MYPLQKLTVPQVVSRFRFRNYNPNLQATTPPVAKVVDAEQQSERDWYFAELVREHREKHVTPARRDWLLSTSGRTEDDLYAALDRAEIHEGKPATSPAATTKRVLEKAPTMTATEKTKTQTEWNAAIAAMQTKHPNWTKSKCIARVVSDNPTLHTRLLESANSR